MPQGALRTAKKPHFVANILLRRMSRIDLMKFIIVWIFCSNPPKSEFDRFAVLKLPPPEASTSGQAASFCTVNRL